MDQFLKGCHNGPINQHSVHSPARQQPQLEAIYRAGPVCFSIPCRNVQPDAAAGWWSGTYFFCHVLILKTLYIIKDWNPLGACEKQRGKVAVVTWCFIVLLCRSVFGRMVFTRFLHFSRSKYSEKEPVEQISIINKTDILKAAGS